VTVADTLDNRKEEKRSAYLYRIVPKPRKAARGLAVLGTGGRRRETRSDLSGLSPRVGEKFSGSLIPFFSRAGEYKEGIGAMNNALKSAAEQPSMAKPRG
jgi:hypothetical protein